jgi:hypothetical protein
MDTLGQIACEAQVKLLSIQCSKGICSMGFVTGTHIGCILSIREELHNNKFLDQIATVITITQGIHSMFDPVVIITLAQLNTVEEGLRNSDGSAKQNEYLLVPNLKLMFCNLGSYDMSHCL